MTELIGAISAVVAVAGVLLNNWRIRGCFVLWVVSNAASAGLHVAGGMWSLAARDIVFLVLSIHGWFMWGQKADTDENRVEVLPK